MRFLKSWFIGVGVVVMMTGVATAEQLPVAQIKVPTGFKIETYARVPGARSISVVESLNLAFVGTRGDSIYAILDANKDRRADRVVRVKTGLRVPNGIVWHAGYLYVAEQHRIVRFKAPDLTTLALAKPEVLFGNLPDLGHHGWRYAGMGPDGMLYVSVGAPCNICRLEGLTGTIIRIKPTGGKPEIFASGVRNSVGFDFQPSTGEMYFTDNGADGMGDDSPPDEFNHAPKKGLWYGFPYFGGGHDRTPNFKGQKLPRTPSFPVVEFGAHVASLGVHFYRGSMFPGTYKNDAFVVQRGSWNRTIPQGYRVMRIRFNESGKVLGKQIFADGWLNKHGEYWGRIVDVKELGDGSLLVSDNHANAVYRITYKDN
jgi:glucose/arabinose dehydrogenase